MDRDIITRKIALAVLGIALVGLLHSWSVAPNISMQGSRLFISQGAAQEKPLETSGIKRESPGTVGQQYQGPFHYKNHNYYTIDCFDLQGGESGE